LGENLISIEDNIIACTTVVIKHLDNNTKCLKVYDFVNGVIDQEENILLATKLDLFPINTTILLKPKILVVMVANLQKLVLRN
jgi:hypothetical protein